MGADCIVKVQPFCDDPSSLKTIRHSVQINGFVFEAAPEAFDEMDHFITAQCS